MFTRRSAAIGFIGAGAVSAAFLAAPALAGIPNAVIGTGRVQKTEPGGGAVVLVNARGHTLYMFTRDRRDRSTCYGSCTGPWQPVLTGGKVFARSGSTVNQRLLGTARRRDGKLQVTYNHHPLYTDTQDRAPGQDYGQHCRGNNGGQWFVISPRGNSITTLINICSGY
jgi:predicted lipoprotein with Yx(FWY)xxD motif